MHDAGFKELDVVDISKDIFTLADKYFTNINNAVTKNPNVNRYITDGRNFLLLSENKYDLISIQISSIWFAGAASLYNREFYKLINKNMNHGGVLQQWVQLHHITPYDLLYIIGTMRSEFKYVWLYVVGEQGILVATNDQEKYPSELQARVLGRIFNVDDLMQIEAGSIHNLTDKILLDPGSVDRMVMSFVERHGDFPVSDDDNNILEYSTPKGNVLDAGKSYDRNLYWLRNYTTAGSK